MNANDKFEFFPATTGNPIGKYKQPKPNTNPAYSREECTLDKKAVSVGNIVKKVSYTENKPVQVRGGKAQTKGKMARGPMA